MLLQLAILKQENPFATGQLSLSYLRLLKQIDNAAVRILLPDVAILEVNYKVAILELFSLDAVGHLRDGFMLVFGDDA